MTFYGRNMNGPDFRLTQFKDKDTFTVDYVLNHKKLTVMYVGPDSQFDGDEYKVTSFKMLVVPKAGEVVPFNSPNDSFPELFKTHIQSGNRVLFADIQFIRNDGSKEIMERSMFYIK